MAARGILNGTTNYILTEMAEKHTNFEQSLNNAQNSGTQKLILQWTSTAQTLPATCHNGKLDNEQESSH